MCQGAALHYVNGRNGVKDFDLWTFFAHDPQQPKYPVRRRGIARFDGPRFDDSTRRVDLLGRTLQVTLDAEPVATLQNYLAQGATHSAWCLSRKAAVGIWPPSLRGQVLWPIVR